MKLLSKFVNGTTDELATGMLSSPLGERVEQLLSTGRRFARGASIAGVIAIGAGLLGTVTIASHSPALVAFAQPPVAAPPADAPIVAAADAPILLAQAAPAASAKAPAPAAPKPARAPDAPTLAALLAQDQLGAQLKELESARAELAKAHLELEKAHAELAAQKAMLESQAKVLEAEFAGLRRELQAKGTVEMRALQRDIYDVSRQLQDVVKELLQQRR